MANINSLGQWKMMGAFLMHREYVFAKSKITLGFAVLSGIMKIVKERNIMDFGWMKLGSYWGMQSKAK